MTKVGYTHTHSVRAPEQKVYNTYDSGYLVHIILYKDFVTICYG